MLPDSFIDISWPKVNPITKVIEPEYLNNECGKNELLAGICYSFDETEVRE